MEKRTFWLTDKSIPDQLKAAYKKAARDKATIQAVSRVLAALQGLIHEVGFHTELQNAVHESLSKKISVVDVLREREIDLLAQKEIAETERQVYQKQCTARQAEVQAVLNECTQELFHLASEVKRLQSNIRGFEKSRSAAHTKYKTAGLSDTDIETIGGVRPTFSELAEWKRQLAEKISREEQISAFLKSSPDYDTNLLASKESEHGKC